ncbi:MAG TPA: addiction module protein [Casimicrobiaceae bacterium]
MKAMTLDQVLQLPIPERIRVVETIWDSIVDHPEALPLTDEQRELEQLYLGLRTVDGLSSTVLRRLAQPPNPLVTALARGWMVETEGRLRCTPEGWLRLDSLVHALTGSVAIS